jgi:hypothetical protein
MTPIIPWQQGTGSTSAVRHLLVRVDGLRTHPQFGRYTENSEIIYYSASILTVGAWFEIFPI